MRRGKDKAFDLLAGLASDITLQRGGNTAASTHTRSHTHQLPTPPATSHLTASQVWPGKSRPSVLLVDIGDKQNQGINCRHSKQAYSSMHCADQQKGNRNLIFPVFSHSHQL